MAYTIDMSSGSEMPSKRWNSRIVRSSALKVRTVPAARSPSPATANAAVKPRSARSARVSDSVTSVAGLTSYSSQIPHPPVGAPAASAAFGQAAELHGQLERLPLSDERDLHLRAGPRPDDAPRELLRRPDGLIVDSDDHVAFLHAGLLGRGALDHVLDQHALLALQTGGLGRLRRD